MDSFLFVLLFVLNNFLVYGQFQFGMGNNGNNPFPYMNPYDWGGNPGGFPGQFPGGFPGGFDPSKCFQNYQWVCDEQGNPIQNQQGQSQQGQGQQGQGQQGQNQQGQNQQGQGQQGQGQQGQGQQGQNQQGQSQQGQSQQGQGQQGQGQQGQSQQGQNQNNNNNGMDQNWNPWDQGWNWNGGWNWNQGSNQGINQGNNQGQWNPGYVNPGLGTVDPNMWQVSNDNNNNNNNNNNKDQNKSNDNQQTNNNKSLPVPEINPVKQTNKSSGIGGQKGLEVTTSKTDKNNIGNKSNNSTELHSANYIPNSHSIDKNGDPKCIFCEVLVTDDDGYQWGYEKNETCKIDTETCNKLNINTKVKQKIVGEDGIRICSDCNFVGLIVKEDMTWWNKEENEECRIIPSRCPNPEFFKYYPYCKGCEIKGMGNDYCLYGEETGPCIIDEAICDIRDKDNDSRFKITFVSASTKQIALSVTTLILILFSFIILN